MFGFGLILFLFPPFLIVKDTQTQSSRILVEPHLIDAEFRKAWMPFFCRSGHPVVTPDQFLGFVGHLLPQEPHLDLPRITGRDLQEVVRAKKNLLLVVVWTGGHGMKLRLFRCPGSLVWLFFWNWLRPPGSGDSVSWMLFFAMIPKADGDSTPLGQRPISVLTVVYRLWEFHAAWTFAGVG